MVGGGAPGGNGSSVSFGVYDRGYGGGGGYTNTCTMECLDDINVQIGSSGGATIVGSNTVSPGSGSNGGSGGGIGEYHNGSNNVAAQSGASDGNSTAYVTHGKTTYRGEGQGKTTRAFGEWRNTLYAGGGGGASCFTTAGSGGAGGGGNGSNSSNNTQSTAGGINTGGGGGGGSRGIGFSQPPFSPGGSDIAIIRWGY